MRQIQSAKLLAGFGVLSALCGLVLTREAQAHEPNSQSEFVTDPRDTIRESRVLRSAKKTPLGTVRLVQDSVPSTEAVSRGIQPFFIKYSKLFPNMDVSANTTKYNFGVSDAEMSSCIDSVIKQISGDNLNYVPGKTTEYWANAINGQVNTCIEKSSVGNKLTPLAKQWLLAEGICEWVRENVYYDDRIDQIKDEAQSAAVNESKYLLREDQMGAVCRGFAVLTRDIARACKLQCDVVNGTFRDILYRGVENPQPSGPNHSVACFIFDGGLEVPADVSSSRGCFLKKPRENLPGKSGLRYIPTVKVGERYILPRCPIAWELFLAGFYPRRDAVQTHNDVQGKHLLITLDETTWRSVDDGYLLPLVGWFENQENLKAKANGSAPTR